MTYSKLTALNPHSATANTDVRGFKRALSLFKAAAKRVPAYADFLKKHEVDAQAVNTAADFQQVPLTDKLTYFGSYALDELSWDGTLDARYISTSSGSTGVPFFWPRGEDQELTSGLIFSNVYEHIFASKKSSTLVVNSFALGTWIAGFEFYNAAKFSTEKGNRLTIVTPGIDQQETIRQIKKLAPEFEQVVILGYPPFVKDVIDRGAAEGIDWAKRQVSLFTGGEAVTELWRERMMEKLGRSGDVRGFVNVYGMAETGIVAHSTPLSLLLKKNSNGFIKDDPGSGRELTGLYQYYPEARYLECLTDSSIVLTSNAGLPLVRYDTRDTGGILDRATTGSYIKENLGADAKKYDLDLKKWQLPFVYLYGRKDLAVSFYALLIYVDNIKTALDRSSVSRQLSGLFVMNVTHTENIDQQFEITVELGRDARVDSDVAGTLTREIIQTLCEVNSEFAKLFSSMGDRARPHVTLVPFGAIDTVPGRKHKWVRK